MKPHKTQSGAWNSKGSKSAQKGVASQKFPSKQSCPVELSMMIEMFYICAFQHGSHLATWDY